MIIRNRQLASFGSTPLFPGVVVDNDSSADYIIQGLPAGYMIDDAARSALTGLGEPLVNQVTAYLQDAGSGSAAQAALASDFVARAKAILAMFSGRPPSQNNLFGGNSDAAQDAQFRAGVESLRRAARAFVAAYSAAPPVSASNPAANSILSMNQGTSAGHSISTPLLLGGAAVLGLGALALVLTRRKQ